MVGRKEGWSSIIQLEVHMKVVERGKGGVLARLQVSGGTPERWAGEVSGIVGRGWEGAGEGKRVKVSKMFEGSGGEPGRYMQHQEISAGGGGKG